MYTHIYIYTLYVILFPVVGGDAPGTSWTSLSRDSFIGCPHRRASFKRTTGRVRRRARACFSLICFLFVNITLPADYFIISLFVFLHLKVNDLHAVTNVRTCAQYHHESPRSFFAFLTQTINMKILKSHF